MVVGILIALQVNNWNEGHNLRKKEINFYKVIESELAETNIELIRKINSLEENLRNVITARNLLIMKVNSTDSLKHYIPQNL